MEYWNWIENNENFWWYGIEDADYHWSEVSGKETYKDLYDLSEMRDWYWEQVKDNGDFD